MSEKFEKFEKLKDMKFCDLKLNRDLISDFFDERKTWDNILGSIIDKIMNKYGIRIYGYYRDEFRKIAKEKETKDKNFDFHKEEVLYYLERY